MIDYIHAAAEGEALLAAAGVPEAKTDARLLLEYVCGTDASMIYREPDRILHESEKEHYFALIERRRKREPLQYITGRQYFFGLEFEVDKRVLVPRPDTEILVESVLESSAGGKLLDLCTGSGCIPVSLLKKGSFSEAVAADLSPEALELAERNAEKLGVKERLHFHEGDLYDALPEEYKGSFDVLTANPPYIESSVIPGLMPEVSEYEPKMALDGGTDGLDLYRRIIAEAPLWLKTGGRIFLEIGCRQAQPVLSLLAENGFTQCGVRKDYASLDRVVCGEYME
ncbi:MAG: peptide chain release factor N(5)-glutamine methyltransferase [Lachnospiraceae bacterium]|nr:peptide chain release factor N(5)-glutamine methyltransferase [Lachnospiraceae bacterium]